MVHSQILNRINWTRNLNINFVYFQAKRNPDGKITRPAPFQSYVMSGTQSRIEPSRSWFSNTKVITQNALQKFQDDMKTAMADPYQVESIQDLRFRLQIQI